MRFRFTLLTLSIAALGTACGHTDSGSTASSASPAGGAAARAPATATLPTTKPACPPNGLWAPCSVLDRLDREGLAPRRDSGTVHEDPLTPAGFRVHLGSAELEVFLYPDSAARKAEQAKLDPHKFITPEQEPSLAGERTMIYSANLLGLLRTPDDLKRERVANAIMSGAPQP